MSNKGQIRQAPDFHRQAMISFRAFLESKHNWQRWTEHPEIGIPRKRLRNTSITKSLGRVHIWRKPSSKSFKNKGWLSLSVCLSGYQELYEQRINVNSTTIGAFLIELDMEAIIKCIIHKPILDQGFTSWQRT